MVWLATFRARFAKSRANEATSLVCSSAVFTTARIRFGLVLAPLEIRCFALSFDVPFSAGTSSGFSVRKFICCVVSSVLLQISIAGLSVISFFSCSNFLSVLL